MDIPQGGPAALGAAAPRLDPAPLTFAGDPLDRAGDRRSEPGWLAARLAEPDALLLPLHDGRPLAEPAPEGGVRLGYAPASLAGPLAADGERLAFLGLWKATPVFALDVEDAAAAAAFAPYGRFEELRSILVALPGPEAAIAGRARALFEWRLRHRFCANCSAATAVADGGWKRLCPSCGAEHFPRTDPVAIMLPVRGDRCLLGRSPRFPPGMMSALAGFVEPGEALEEACAREIEEEAGLKATAVRYRFSQPWPFPHSLMLGLIAEVGEGEERPQPGEIEELRWFTRPEAARLAAGETVDGRSCPPPTAIAHRLIQAWSAEG